MSDAPPPPGLWPLPQPPLHEPDSGRARKRRLAAVVLVVLVAVIIGPLVLPSGARWFRDTLQVERPPCTEATSILATARAVRLTPTGRALAQSLILSPGADWVLDANHAEGYSLVSYAHGGQEEAHAWQRALADARFRQAWKRAWLRGGPTAYADSFAEEVLEFDTPGGASQFNWWLTNHMCGVALDAFDVPELPGAVGMRFYRPFDTATVDQIWFSAGKRHYTLELAAVVHGPDREELLGLAHQAIELATASGDACADARHLIARATNWADRGSHEPIEHLSGLVPFQPPHGFRLLTKSGGVVELGKFGTPPQFQRTWTDGVSDLIGEVIQFPDVDTARRSFQETVASKCEGASAVQTMEEIPGSVLLFVQEDESLTQFVFFLRGSREYDIVYSGPPSETPGETLSIFARRAVELAR